MWRYPAVRAAPLHRWLLRLSRTGLALLGTAGGLSILGILPPTELPVQLPPPL